jgi:hypothetical protein
MAVFWVAAGRVIWWKLTDVAEILAAVGELVPDSTARQPARQLRAFVHFRAYNSPQRDPVVSQTNPFNSSTSYFVNINFNIILPGLLSGFLTCMPICMTH